MSRNLHLTATSIIISFFVTGCSSEEYGRSGGRWVWFTKRTADGFFPDERELDSAEGNLEVLSDEHFAKTKDYVYFRGIRIHQADPDTFQLIQSPFSKDGTQVFCGTLPILGADPETFRILTETPGNLSLSFSVDKTSLEMMNGPHPAFSEEEDVLTGGGWSTDGKKCFHGYGEIAGADPKSFEILNPYYARDANNVYFGIHVVEGADLNTFTPETANIVGFFAEDKNFVYECGKRARPVDEKE